MVFFWIVFIVVYSQYNGEIHFFAGGADYYFFSSRGEMFLGSGTVGEKAGTFDDEVDFHGFPWKFCGIFFAKDFVFLAFNKNTAVFGDNVCIHYSVVGIVFEEMGEGFGVGKVVYGDDVKIIFQEVDVENLSADSAKTIDGDFEFHGDWG